MNSDERLLRRYQDDLYVSGAGSVLMGAWSIVRVFIKLFLGTEDMLDFGKYDPDERTFAVVVTVVIIGFLCALIMNVHLYIGLNSIRAAKGVAYKKGYFKATVFFLILSIVSMVTYGEELKDLENIDTTIAAILVDLTTIYIFIIVIVSTVKIRKINEKIGRE